MNKSASFFILIFFMVIASSGCKKSADRQCTGALATGRIIGYDPCLNYTTFNKVDGAGFVIEINNENAKDTVVTYDIPGGLFTFLPQYRDGLYSSYLFRPDVQDLFRIKFNYHFAKPDEKTIVICNGTINTADFSAAVKESEVIVSCISSN